MEQNHYNLKKLVRIEVQDFRKLRHPRYQEKVTFLGFTIEKEGWHGYLSMIDTSIEDYLKRNDYKLEALVIKEKEIIEKPYVRLLFQNEQGFIKYFETLQDAQDFAANIKDLANTNWITNQPHD